MTILGWLTQLHLFDKSYTFYMTQIYTPEKLTQFKLQQFAIANSFLSSLIIAE